MKSLLCLLGLSAFTAFPLTGSSGVTGRESLLLDFDWRFHFGDIRVRNSKGIHKDWFESAEWLKAGNQGVAWADYDDHSWARVDLPHDFVIERAAFSPEAPAFQGSLLKGLGWYRKTFRLPAADADRRISLEFDGVFRNSMVWVNGHFIKAQLSGYGSFAADITEVCNFGGANTIAVRVDATEGELWSYEGGGIYREVRLVKTAPVHVDHWGTCIRCTIAERPDPAVANVTIDTTVVNMLRFPASCDVLSEVVDTDGRIVARARSPLDVGAESRASLHQTTAIEKPRLWSPSDPHRYRLVTSLIQHDDEVMDRYETPFGVRSIRFDPETGFHLNGVPLKIKGACDHQDSAGVGVALPPRLETWRVEQLKKMGCNAIRTAHNQPDPALVEACDRLGVMLMDEVRLSGASDELLGQLESLIRRDRNHPSVVLWSLGNEEMLIQHTTVGIRIFQRMQDLAHQLDPTRPCTYAMNGEWIKNADFLARSGFHFDVFGANYTNQRHPETYDEFHRQHPQWPLLGSETGGSASTRGLFGVETVDGKPLEVPPGPGGEGWAIWLNPKRKGIVSGYSELVTLWGRTIEETWQDCADRPYMAGTFLWSGFDYRGETFPYFWPADVSRFGLMDLCGFPKDSYWYYRAWWQEEPVLHLLPHWNWAGHEGQPIDVWCYSNSAAVELFLNGRSLGRKSMPKNGHLAWSVPYAPGTLEARGFDSAGQPILVAKVETAGAPAALRATPDRSAIQADNQDLAVVDVAVIDASGNLVPDAANAIAFKLTGPARILGVGNGAPDSHEPDKADHRLAYHGLCQALVQAARAVGPIQITVSSPGLASTTVTFHADSCESRPWVPSAGTAEEQNADALANPVNRGL